MSCTDTPRREHKLPGCRSRWRSPLSRGPVSVTRAVRFVLSGSVHRARQRGIMRRNFLAFLLFNASAIAVAQTPSPTPGPIWIQEPSSYRLVRFGASFDEAQRTLSLRGCTKSHGEVNCGGYFRVSDVYVDEMLTFSDEKFVEATWSFPSTSFEEVRRILSEKYGPPHHETRNTVTNRMGGTFQDELLNWTGRTVTIGLQRFGGTLDKSTALFVTNAYMGVRRK